MKKLTYFEFFCIFCLMCFTSTIFCTNMKTDFLRQTKFPPCKACKIFVNSFQKGMELTAKGKFEGGDAAWEEEKLKSYAKSEVRLTEIQEKLCTDIEKGRDQCYSIHEQHDDLIEEWWFKYQETEPDLYNYFCIKSLKYCCPEIHYGPDCLPCPGYPDNVCSHNGKCKGAGTRVGDGKCKCAIEYVGENCNECAKSYFASYKDGNKLICSKCHISCNGQCSKSGAAGCEDCTSGWIMDKDKGCIDVNECAHTKPVCGPLQFCVNNEGHYNCLECDPSCASCIGDGPDMCVDCANGFVLINNVCVDSKKPQRQQYQFITRFLTYLGLLIATYIIFQRSMVLAAIIGLAVALYITVAEYMLNISMYGGGENFLQNFLM